MRKRSFLAFACGAASATAINFSYSPIRKWILNSYDPDILLSRKVRLSPWTVDLHHGILRGTGWLGGDAAFTEQNPPKSIAVTNPGSSRIDVDRPDAFRRGQLICYRGFDRNFHSAKVSSIGSNTLVMDRAIETGVDVGSVVSPFYVDSAHPNMYGYATIADQALLQLSEGKSLSINNGDLSWSSSEGTNSFVVNIGEIDNASYYYPASTSAWDMSGFESVPGGYVFTEDISLPAGSYALIIPIVFLTGAVVLENISVEIESSQPEGKYASQELAKLSLRDGMHRLVMNVSFREATVFRIKILNAGSASMRYSIGESNLVMRTDKGHSFNHGKHVLLGDSWFASGFLMDRLRERLPKGTFVNKGAAGERTSQILDRFKKDVAPERPDYVWVLAGTNDYYADTGVDVFNGLIGEISSEIKKIGAQGIFFDPSVGDANYSLPPGERLSISRAYKKGAVYRDSV